MDKKTISIINLFISDIYKSIFFYFYNNYIIHLIQTNKTITTYHSTSLEPNRSYQTIVNQGVTTRT